MTTLLVTAALGLFAAPDGAVALARVATATTAQQQNQDDASPPRRRGAQDQRRNQARPDRPPGQRRGGPGGFGRFTPPPHPLMTALDTDKDGVISAEEMEKAAAALKTLDKNEDGKLSAEELNPFSGAGFSQGRGFGFRGGFGGRGEPGARDGAGRRGQGGRGGFAPGGLDRGRFGGQAGVGAGRGPQGGAFGAPNSVEVILSRDQNGDRKVTKDEWLAPMVRIFVRADANGDGAIDEAEAEKMAEQFRPRGRARDGQGRPGFGGFGGRGGNFAARLMQLDTDGDGKVTKDEVPERMQRAFERFDANGDGAIDKTEAEQAAQSFTPPRGDRRGSRDARPRRRPEAEDAPQRGEQDNAPRDDNQAK